MKKRNFSHTGAAVSRMGIGAMSFSNFYGVVFTLQARVVSRIAVIQTACSTMKLAILKAS